MPPRTASKRKGDKHPEEPTEEKRSREIDNNKWKDLLSILKDLNFDVYDKGSYLEASNTVNLKDERLKIHTPPGIVTNSWVHGCGRPPMNKPHGYESKYELELTFGELPETIVEANPGLVQEHQDFINFMLALGKRIEEITYLDESVRPGERQNEEDAALQQIRRILKDPSADVDRADIVDQAMAAFLKPMQGKFIVTENDDGNRVMQVRLKCKSLYEPKDTTRATNAAPLDLTGASDELQDFYHLCGPGAKYKQREVKLCSTGGELLFVKEMLKDPIKKFIHEGDLASADMGLGVWSQKRSNTGTLAGFGIKTELLPWNIVLHRQSKQTEVADILSRYGGSSRGSSDYGLQSASEFSADRDTFG